MLGIVSKSLEIGISKMPAVKLFMLASPNFDNICACYVFSNVNESNRDWENFISFC